MLVGETMKTMGSRIKELRKGTGLTLEKFGARIGITPASLSNIENNKTNPSDQTVLMICREFNVNEDWLRDGTGEPFMQLSREDTIAAYVGRINGGKITDIEESIIKFMAETSVEEWETLASALRRFAATIKKPDTE